MSATPASPRASRRVRPLDSVPFAIPLLAVSLAASLAACASSNPEAEPMSGAGTPVPVRVQTSPEVVTTLNTMPTTSEANSAVVNASVGRAWSALADVYAELGLTPTQFRSGDHLLTVENARIKRQLGNVTLTRYLECGMGQSGANATNYEVTMNLRSQLRAVDSTHTEVRTLLDATARPVAVSGTQVTCQTTNALEQHIAKSVAKKAGGS